ncbi:MAG: hypothetical protein PHF00_13360, partial [Elusimicrobia bacterium]|nr:hypothetical protein [Elusimicrobiota bacterium]
MKSRLWAGMVLCAYACGFPCPAASASVAAGVQVSGASPAGRPVAIVPAGQAGARLGGGALDFRGSLPGMTGLIAPRAAVEFRAEPPRLPASAIGGAVSVGAAVESPGARLSPWSAEPGRAPAALPAFTASPLAEPELRPGPGGGRPELVRQALRLDAKARALASELRSPAQAGAWSQEDSRLLGARVMAVLTEGLPPSGSGPDAGARRGLGDFGVMYGAGASAGLVLAPWTAERPNADAAPPSLRVSAEASASGPGGRPAPGPAAYGLQDGVALIA